MGNDLTIGGGGGGVTFALSLTTLQEIRDYCTILSKTSLVPKAYLGKPDDIMVAGQMGARLGLDLFQSLQSIATINGNPSIYGDAGLAIVRNSNLLEEFDEWFEIDGQRVKEVPDLIDAEKKGHRIVAWCLSKRKGAKQPRITSYSVADAKLAHLWMKKGYNGQETPWCTNPKRMMIFRCRGFNLRDEFGDVLKGLKFFEEVQDYDTPEAAAVIESAPKPTPEKTPLAALLKGKASVPIDVTPTPEPEPAPTPEPTPDTLPPEAEAISAKGVWSEATPTPNEESQAEASAVVDQSAEIGKLIALLNQTPKGTALVNGLRKMFKLKGSVMIPDIEHHALYVQALKGAVEKIES